jgi:hypothetical protein
VLFSFAAIGFCWLPLPLPSAMARDTGPVLSGGLLAWHRLPAAPTQRRPISMVMMGEENVGDHAARTSGGLPADFNNVP